MYVTRIFLKPIEINAHVFVITINTKLRYSKKIIALYLFEQLKRS